MPRELSEFVDIVDGKWSEGPDMKKVPSDDELRRALQLLLTRQCIYADMPNLGRLYEIIRHYAPFVERYFSALGYDLVVSNNEQMIALKVPVEQSRYDTVFLRFKKDETLILLTLALLREEALSRQEVGDFGRIETTTGDLIDRYKNITQQEPPDERRLMEILRDYAQRGAVRLGERDRVEKVTPLTIMPGVTVIAPDTFIDSLRTWAASPPERDMPKNAQADHTELDAAE